MNRKKLRDILISSFLISTLGLATFIVSCSEESSIVSADFNPGDGYHPHVHDSGIPLSAITTTFSSVGQGAAFQAGYMGMGWLLSAMGLTTASGAQWQEEFNKISNDLDQIINLLNSVNQELADIESTLNIINCTLQQTSLQSDLAAIQTEYNLYQSLALTASQGDTISNAAMMSFANDVINGTGTQVSIANALSNIYVNAGSVIQGCLQVIQPPQSGTYAQDTVYYDQANSLLNNYYFYQTIGLGLLSEAYHYKAWVAAGSPGGSQGYSSDSVQLVCSANSNASLLCNNVVVETNTVYNTLINQFKLTGAQYTGSDLLYQKNTSGQDLVWVRSLEDFTQQAGVNCTFPLTSIGNNFQNPACGPTAGLVGSSLSYTDYYGTQNFEYPGFQELNGLVNPLPDIPSNQPVYVYLESLGFENMNNKVLTADTLVFIKSTSNSNIYIYFDTMHVVPFISNFNPEFTNHNGVKKAMYSETADFLTAFKGYGTEVISGSGGCKSWEAPIKVWWEGYGNATVPPAWGIGKGYINLCKTTDQYYNISYYNSSSFTWDITDPNNLYDAPTGWSYYAKNSYPQKGYFIPVRTNFTGSAGCLTGYSNLNAGGFITKCGQDFQDYLNLNLPVPPTCSIPNATPCTPLP